jgi:hypothetical protein
LTQSGHKPLKTALKKAGFKVDKVEQGSKKTVFTVSKIQRAVRMRIDK